MAYTKNSRRPVKRSRRTSRRSGVRVSSVAQAVIMEGLALLIIFALFLGMRADESSQNLSQQDGFQNDYSQQVAWQTERYAQWDPVSQAHLWPSNGY